MRLDEALQSVENLGQLVREKPDEVRHNLVEHLDARRDAFNRLGMSDIHRQLVADARSGKTAEQIFENFETVTKRAAEKLEADAVQARDQLSADMDTLIEALHETNRATPGLLARVNLLREYLPDIVDQAVKGVPMCQNIVDTQRTNPETVADFAPTVEQVAKDWAHKTAASLEGVYNLYYQPEQTRRDVPNVELEGVLDYDPERHRVCEHKGVYYVIDKSTGELGNDKDAAVVHPDGTRKDAEGNPYDPDQPGPGFDQNGPSPR